MNPKPQNIWCIGRNYAEHAKELGNAVPIAPIIFLKAVGCLNTVQNPDSNLSRDIELPPHLDEVHHELELVLRFASSPLHDNPFCFDAVAIGLDLTDRKTQTQLKSQGHPWELAKSFSNAAPISEFIPVKQQDFQNFYFELSVNGQLRQAGSPTQMIFPPDAIAKHLYQYFPVQAGDYLFTGTPAGVGPIKRGDHLVGRLRKDHKSDSEILIQTLWKMI